MKFNNTLNKIRTYLTGGEINWNTAKLTGSQLIILLCFIAVSIIVKIILIQFNQTDGEGVTRVWNAYWWSEHPFFVLPISGHPLWFYVIGPIFFIFKDIYLVPIYIMILMMTISGIYVFKITYLISDFRSGLLGYCIFTITPVLFWFNFTPFTYQFLPFLYIIMVYYFIRAVQSGKVKYFVTAGVFAFLSIALRAEAITVLVPFCILAILLGKKGAHRFIFLALIFQVIWWLYSLYLYGNPIVSQINSMKWEGNGIITGLHPGLRLKGFFLPYFFLVTGMTFFLFYFFVTGLIRIYIHCPKYIFVALMIPILLPALANGSASVSATIFHSVYYIVPMYFFAPVFSAVGLSRFLWNIKKHYLRLVTAGIILFSAIPFAYIKDALPQKYKTLYPKAIQPLMTTEFPEETRVLFSFIASNIEYYPALIYDFEGFKESNELCVVYRSRLIPPYTALITTYNVPNDEMGLVEKLKEFIKKNPNGMMIVKNRKTLLNDIIVNKDDISSLNISLNNVVHSEHFTVFLFTKR